MKSHRKNHFPLRIGVLALCVTLGVLWAIRAAAETYTIKKGDTISGIASKHEVPKALLMSVNGITNPKRLQIGQKLTIPDPDAPTEYTVVSGDTLAGIASKHDVGVRDLIDLNKLKNPDQLRIGQTLKLPAGTPPALSGVRDHPLLPSSVRRDMGRIRVRPGWKYIIIHHSATRVGTVKGMDEYHRKKRRMKNGLAYHFVIGNGRGMGNGEVAIGDRWRKQIQGGHLASEPLNRISIGICLVGNFEKDYPSEAQLRSLEALLADLLDRTGLEPSAIRTHRAINNRPTRCPGRRFPIGLVKSNF